MSSITIFNMLKDKISVSDYNFSNWIDELKFQELELKKCEINLEKIMRSNEGPSTLFPKVEHFQNQFLIQESNINKLKNEIRKFDKWTNKIEQQSDIQKSRKYYQFLEKKMRRQRIVVNEVIEEFMLFFKSEFLNNHFTF